MITKPTTIDAYLAMVSDDEKRTALENLRKTIIAIVPAAVECISYGLPAFRLDNRVLVGFGAAKNHCAFYPWSGSTLNKFPDEITKYERTPGSLHFQPDNPLPEFLVRKLIEARIVENKIKYEK